MELLVFLIFAFLAVASALVVVAHKNPVYSTMALVVTLFSVAVLFVLLGAPFIGVLQVLIYTGAIVVLFLFVIMLLNIGAGTQTVDRTNARLDGAANLDVTQYDAVELYFLATNDARQVAKMPSNG